MFRYIIMARYIAHIFDYIKSSTLYKNQFKLLYRKLFNDSFETIQKPLRKQQIINNFIGCMAWLGGFLEILDVCDS